MEKNIEYKKKAEELGVKKGFDQISFYGEWNGYLAYTASRKEDEECCIGYPIFILVNDSGAHMASYKQSPDIMGIVSLPKDYTSSFL